MIHETGDRQATLPLAALGLPEYSRSAPISNPGGAEWSPEANARELRVGETKAVSLHRTPRIPRAAEVSSRVCEHSSGTGKTLQKEFRPTVPGADVGPRITPFPPAILENPRRERKQRR